MSISSEHLEFLCTKLKNVFLVKQHSFGDERGEFVKLFDTHDIGIAQQANWSFSKKNVLRGLHFQPKQEKLVYCIRGGLYDVVLDLRKSSSTYKQWYATPLVRGIGIYVPDGCAHGFYAMEDSEALYFSSAFYDTKTEGGIRWNDPAFKIYWPCMTTPILSARDQAHPDWSED